MKCPKCGYIGFEAVDRCRNCGYEFALAARPPVPASDLEIRSDPETDGPLVDLALLDAQILGRRRTPAGKEIDLDRIIGAPDTPPDLPLFGGGQPAPDPQPLVTPGATPRKPLAVRRTTPPIARSGSAGADPRQPGTRNLELPLPARPTPAPRVAPRERPAAPAAAEPAGDPASAPPVPRVLAASIDLLLLAAIDALVVYFTLRLCSLSLGEAALLPIVPLAAFFLLLNGGYLVAFTSAGGQTIGKMAFGLKVLGADGSSVSVPAATLRSAGCLLSTLCLGAGLVPAFLGGRALHDRLADTRVVQVIA